MKKNSLLKRVPSSSSLISSTSTLSLSSLSQPEDKVIQKRRKRNRKLRGTKTSTSRSEGKPSPILVLGAAGRTGYECLKRLSRHESNPIVHGFCFDSLKIPEKERDHLCDERDGSIIEGDATNENHIEKALKRSKAQTVIVCIGDSEKNDDVFLPRTASAIALVRVLSQRRFQRVCAIVVSKEKSKPTYNIINKKRERRRQIMFEEDHDGQEKAFLGIRDRVTIVRPTKFKDYLYQEDKKNNL